MSNGFKFGSTTHENKDTFAASLETSYEDKKDDIIFSHTSQLRATKADLFRFYLEVEEEFMPVITMTVAAARPDYARTETNVTAYSKTPRMLKQFLAGRRRVLMGGNEAQY